ncbi:hypothetical protein EXS74_01050 [Candidatus Woesearchaeota archaeon]|nr:hypothetical protein [Candidatus Woesearchaeota archaeon]
MDYYLLTYKRIEDAVFRDGNVFSPDTTSYNFIVPSTADIAVLEKNIQPWLTALGLDRQELFLSLALNLRFSGVTTVNQAERYLEKRLSN